MRKYAIFAALIAAVVAAPTPAVSDEPIEINGMTFDSWSDYGNSDYFRSNGLRCGFRATPEQEKAAAPGDCAYTSTNPDPMYDPGPNYPLQVVVHVIMNSSGTQGFIDSAMVQSGIDIINEDFQAILGTNGENGTDAGMIFQLAGITYSQNNTWFNDGGGYYNTLAWDPTQYINVYTNNNGALGYVPFLPQNGSVGSNSDRVVVLWSTYGRNGPYGPPYDQGRTLTHELGHYFGLWHVFDNGCGTASAPGCYNSGDFVCDTNTDSSPHWNCASTNSCGTFDPIDNYMEYTPDLCMEKFTVEQVRRMRCTLLEYRSGLINAALAVDDAAPVGAPQLVVHQNRPNPFNPTTRIAFELPTAGNARVDVYDVSGRVVNTLLDGHRAAGRNFVDWNGTNSAGQPVVSGVYLYRVATESGSETKRMMLMK